MGFEDELDDFEGDFSVAFPTVELIQSIHNLQSNIKIPFRNILEEERNEYPRKLLELLIIEENMIFLYQVVSWDIL